MFTAKMKARLFLLLFLLTMAVVFFFSPSAFAKNVAELENKSGGKIILTDETCDDTNTQYIAFTATGDGKTLFDCWDVVGEFVMVKWNDGDVYSYPTSAFALIPKARQ